MRILIMIDEDIFIEHFKKGMTDPYNTGRWDFLKYATCDIGYYKIKNDTIDYSIMFYENGNQLIGFFDSITLNEYNKKLQFLKREEKLNTILSI